MAFGNSWAGLKGFPGMDVQVEVSVGVGFGIDKWQVAVEVNLMLSQGLIAVGFR